jgi:uncharacterized delta-60 repeat protein
MRRTGLGIHSVPRLALTTTVAVSTDPAAVRKHQLVVPRRWMLWAGVVVGLLLTEVANAQKPIAIDGNFSDWSTLDIVGTDAAGDVGPTDAVDWLTLWAKFENGNLMISYQTQNNIDFNNNAWRYGVFLDIDSNPTTGYRGSRSEYRFGAEYLVEGGTIYRYTGSGTTWAWSSVGSTTYAINGNRLEMQIPGGTIGMIASSRIKIMLVGNNDTTSDFARNDLAGFAYPRDRIVLNSDLTSWSGVTPLGTDPAGDASGDIVDWVDVRALRQNGTLYLSYTTVGPIDLANNGWRYNLLIDTDNNPNTGFTGLPGGIGAEYLIQGSTLYRYMGTGKDWSWSKVTPLSVCVSGTQLELAVAEQYLGLSGSSYALGIRLFGDNPTTWDLAPDLAPGFRTTLVNVAQGDLDLAFGSGGKVTTDFFGGDDSAAGVAIQNDGKIIVVGTTSNPKGQVGTDFALARYRPDGTLDTGFGTNRNGKVATDFFGSNDAATGVAVQPDGMIVAAGTTIDPQHDAGSEFALARYGRNGTLDPQFGNNGKAANSFLGGNDVANGITIQSDAKIVVVGNDGGGNFLLARYNSNGSLDGSFGMGGFVIASNYPPGTSPGGANAVTVQPDGKIVVAGTVMTPPGNPSLGPTTTGQNIAVARYNTDGSPDTSFGSSGMTGVIAYGQAHAVAMLPSGDIVVAGDSYFSLSGRVRREITLARLNKNGGIVSVATSPFLFLNGINVGQSEEVGAAGIAIQPDGDIVTAGTILVNENGILLTAGHDFALTRFSGSLGFDNSFGTNLGLSGGIVVTDFSGKDDSGTAMALQADGSIVVVGTTANLQGGTGKDFAIARYH